jgi:hypothetical protein
MRKAIAIFLAGGATIVLLALLFWAFYGIIGGPRHSAFVQTYTDPSISSQQLHDTTPRLLDTSAPQAPIVPPPAATTQTVSQIDRRQYLLKLWSHSRSNQSTADPLLRTQLGTILPVPELHDGDPDSASTVTIHQTGTIYDVLEQIAQQTRTRVGAEHPGIFRGDTPIHLDLDRAPMLEALMEVCSQAGLKLVRSEPGDASATADPHSTGQSLSESLPRIVLGQSMSHRAVGRWCTSGPFEYEVTQIEHGVPLSPSSMNGEFLTISIEAHVEPKLRVFSGPGVFSLEEAVDENGNNLVTPEGAWKPPSMQDQMAIHMAYPASNPGHRIVRLRATDHCVIAKTFETVEIPLPKDGSPPTQTAGGMLIYTDTSDQQNGNSGVYMFKLTIHKREGGNIDWPSFTNAAHGIVPRLETADGNVLDPIFHTELQVNSDSIVFTPQWWKRSGNRQESPPVKIVMDVPIELRSVDVPVQFDNLPLP